MLDKEHIWVRETDVNGNKFRGYSVEYGENKRAGKLLGQTPPSKRSKAPFVSGRFRNNLKYRGATDSQFKIGWDARGFIVNHLATLKRFVTTQKRPFPRDVRIEIDRQVDREIGRKLPPSKKTKIVFGK